MNNTILKYIFMALMLATAAGCHRDEPGVIPPTPADDGVVLQFRVPNPNGLVTRTITEADENFISTVDVLVFKDNGSGNPETFLYQTHATDIDNNDGSPVKRLKAVLKKSESGEKHRIVLLANLRSEINSVRGSFNNSLTKADVLEMITFDSENEWNTTSSSNFTPLPMWGETVSAYEITDNTTSATLGVVDMMRSVARVDITTNLPGINAPFILKYINVYNSNKVGFAAPVPANLDNEGKATIPTLPNTSVTNSDPLEYTLPDGSGNNFVRGIYLSEAAATTDDQTSPCIVIGGYYNSSQLTWYRIDLYDKSFQDNTRLDILRNFRYLVNITSIGGPGYFSADIALTSKPVNMETEIEAIDERDLNNISFDGSYYLAVDKEEISLFKEGNPKEMKVQTNHDNGWSISSKPSWLTVTPSSYAGTDARTIELYADPVTAERTGTLVIVAGKIRKEITVVQENKPEISISVDPESLTFRQNGVLSKTIEVTTYPTGLPVKFSVAGDIEWDTDGFPTNGQVATTFSFKPKVNNSGSVQNSIVTVYVEKDGEIAAQTISVKQLTSNIIFGVTTYNNYPAAGGSDMYFTANTDVDWYLVRIGGQTGILDDLSTATNPAGITQYYFTLKPNNTYETRTVDLYLDSSDPDFDETQVQLIQDFAPPFLATVSHTGDVPEIDFGTSTTPVSLRFRTNTGWSFSQGTEFSKVVGSTSHTANTTHTGGQALYPAESALTLTPRTWLAQTGTPVAGTRVNTTLTLNTANHAPATGVQKTVSIMQTVPHLFDLVSFSATTIGYGESVTVTVNTNSAWSLKDAVNSSNIVYSAASEWSAKSLTITPPNNHSWRPQTIYLYYDWYTSTNRPFSKAITQNGYYMTSITHSATGTIPAAKTNVTVTGTGWYSSITIRVIDADTGEELHEELYLLYTSGPGSDSKPFPVPANKENRVRRLKLQYYKHGYQTWHDIGSVFTQAAES